MNILFLCISFILSISALILSIIAFTKKENFEKTMLLEWSSQEITNLKLAQKKMTRMLETVDKLCQANNISYWLVAGTLLGTVRNKGWIPWDGDIDIGMTRKDYNKFKRLSHSLPDSMKLIDGQNSKHTVEAHSDGDGLPLLAKIKDKNSCMLDHPDTQGTSYWNSLYKKRINWDPYHVIVHDGLQVDIFIYDKIGKKLVWRLKKPSSPIYSLNIEDVFPLQRVLFDKVMVNAPNNRNKILTGWFGKDYMKLPPIKERYSHEGKVDPYTTCSHHHLLD